VQQGTGDVDAPPLPAGELPVTPVEELLEADEVGKLGDLRIERGTRATRERRPRRRRFSRTVSAESRSESWKTTPITSRTRSPLRRTSCPRTRTLPESNGSTVVRHPMVVDLPAPLVPTKANTPPLATAKEMSSTATFSRYRFVNPVTSIAIPPPLARLRPTLARRGVPVA
jgi:hypothetical protein